jgi:hypothetical protein
MIDPDDHAQSSIMASDSATASPITDEETAVGMSTACSSSVTSLTSHCWNHLPRDCLLHIFSFHDFFAITRMTAINHFWHRCLKRGLMTRIVEHSWKILKCKKSQPSANTLTPSVAPLPVQLPSLSSIISPLFDDDIVMHDAPIVSGGAAVGIASPALSALPPSSALKSISTLNMPGSGFPVSINQPGAPFSSSSTLFKASVVHLDSLYLGQKQLRYSLHSNPLYQHLWLMYHVSWCQQRVLEVVRNMHVAVYRNTNSGKWPRSTKLEQGGDMTIDGPATAMGSTHDLMPLHLNVSTCIHWT